MKGLIHLGASATLFALALTASSASGQQSLPSYYPHGPAKSPSLPMCEVVYAGTEAGRLYRFELESGKCNWIRSLPSAEYVECIAACRDGDVVSPPVIVATSSTTYLLDGRGKLYSSTPHGVASADYVQLSQVAIDERGEYAVAAHNDGFVRLYRISPPPLAWALVWQWDFAATSVAIDDEGRRVAAAGSDGVGYWQYDGVAEWTPADAQPEWTDSLNGYHGLTVSVTPEVALGAVNLYVAVGSSDRRVFLFNRLGEQQWTFDTLPDYASVALDADGKLVACGNDDPGNSNGAQLDGRPTPTSSFSAWSYRPGTGGGDDCYAIQAQHESYGGPGWFASGGSGAFGVFVHGSSGNLIWSGVTSSERHRVAIADSRVSNYTYVVTADIGQPYVHLYKTDQSTPRFVKTLSSNCRALSIAWGPGMLSLP